MNSQKRSGSNRRRWRRQLTTRVALITVVCVLLILFVAFLLVGNLLLKRNASGDEQPKPTPSTEDNEPQPLPKAPQIQAYPIVAETTDSTTFQSRLKQLTDQGVTAVSLPLNTADRALLYRSPVGEALGWQTAGSYTVTLDRVASVAKQSNVYLSATFYLTAFSQEDDLMRAVLMAETAAVAAEAIRSGVGEILFLVPDLSETQSEELARFLQSLRALEPDAVLGLAIPPTLLTQEGGRALLNDLEPHLNFLALDATDPQNGGTPDSISAVIHDTENHYQLLYYEMRLLLPRLGTTEEQNAILAVAEESGIRNWQIVG